MNKKILIIRVSCILFLILLAVCMYVIGKQHYIYVDNKDFGSYKALSYCEVSVDKQDSIELMKRDRDVFTVVNQNHKFKVEANGVEREVKLKLPINTKNFIINIPAFINGEDQSVYMSEFIMEPVKVIQDEVIITDDMNSFE